ncbi:putative bifunctional diguanylate cyclase/phosphodiesterase [Asticcacaulis machinosus]|uniref:EAL domain-containing protein n=1 Tax=Asticcacaulis machinosus TaxID=2984211 RepID=A0ABT5HHP7_9CAUL|nr:EAL domain-containing protein [Asticcacaulis machinosus]MDC7675685.1 EAL domain-containing protein [Asticcacaulis machinosus]
MQKALFISDITDQIAPIAPDCPNAVIYDLFRDTPDLMVVAVADTDGTVLGLIERHTFNLRMAAEFGRALFSRKPVTAMMDADPLRVDIGTPLRDFTRATLAERPSELMRGFIATHEGKYVGVGTGLSVLKAISADLQNAFDLQQVMTQDLLRLSAEAQRSQVFLNTVINNIPAMVLVKNADDQRIRLINHAGERLFNVRASDVVGKTSQELFPADVTARILASDRKALEGSEAVVMDDEIFTDAQQRKRVLQLKKTVLRSDDGTADSIITLGMDLTEQKEAEARIAQLAHYDPLTGLANRALFATDLEKSLSRAQRSGRSFALMCLDLDRFKAVNDSYGHLMGDQLLIQVAERLRACVRKGDLIARMGGDEFAVIQDITRPDDAQHLAGRIVEAMKAPFKVGDMRFQIGISIGIVIAPQDGLDPHNLLSRADLAMYRVKAEGRNGWCFFKPEMDEQLQRRLEMEQDLKRALADNQFQLYFQPLLNLDTQEITSFEALLRWHHPVRGMVSPAEFIPVAEESGLIGPLGEWVLKTACNAAATWSQPWRIAVNISPLQFRHKSLPVLVKKALKAAGLPASRLELEITESVLLENEKQNLSILTQIRDMGVRIAMDDFGTGYSSLSYLRAFPFDKIKIDQSFVRDLPHDRDALSIIRAITDMAQSLGVRITAEGVETQAQMDALKELGCHEAQGYLIGRPAPGIEAYCPEVMTVTKTVAA